MTMAWQANIINAVMAAHNVACHVAPPPVSYQTSGYNAFVFRRTGGLKVSAITGLTPELEEALGVPIRFSPRPLTLEVARPDSQRLPLVSLWPQLRPQSGGLWVALGQTAVQGRLLPQRLNLADANTPHALIAGTTGSGKTVLLREMILSAAAMQSPATLAMVILDPKAVDFRSLYGLPHLACNVVSDPQECIQALAAVVAELERRKVSGMLEPEQRIIVAVDELADLMAVAGGAVEAHIQRIISVGRGLGVHIIAATQHPLSAVVGSVIKANFPVRLVGRVADGNAARVAAGIPDTGAERLPGKGSFLCINGTTHRTQAYHCTLEEERKLMAALCQRWDGTRPHYALRLDAAKMIPTSVAIPEGEITAKSNEAEMPSWVTPAIRNYINKHGKVPSQRQVQTLVKKRTGKMLPWPVIKAAIAGCNAIAT